MKKTSSCIPFLLALLLLSFSSAGQSVAVNNDGTSPDPSAMLDIKSTNKGMLIPRLTTTQRLGITSPAPGLLVFDIDNNSFWFYNSVSWTQITTGPTSPWLPNGNNISASNSGNVGIGVSTPLFKLHVANLLGNTQFILGPHHQSGGFTSLYMGTSALSNGYSFLQSVRAAGSSFGDLNLNPNAGNVGIRTTIPRGIFDIGGGDEGIYLTNNTTTGNQRIAYMPGDIFMSPWAGTNISYFEARRSDNSGSTSLQMRTYNNGNPNDALFISSLSKIGINNNNPVATVEINQIGDRGLLLRGPTSDYWEQKVAYDPNGFPPPTLQFYHNGVLRAQVSNTTGAWSPVSDARLKTNVLPLSPVLGSVLKLVPSSYEMLHNNPQKERSIGFIAQQVKEIFPEAVKETISIINDVKTGLYTLDYTALNVYAIKAIQEQQVIIERLQHELLELKKMINPSKN